MAKCRGLLQENQELGKQISQGRVAQLEAEIVLHKKYNQEIKQAQEGVAFFLWVIMVQGLWCTCARTRVIFVDGCGFTFKGFSIQE